MVTFNSIRIFDAVSLLNGNGDPAFGAGETNGVLIGSPPYTFGGDPGTIAVIRDSGTGGNNPTGS